MFTALSSVRKGAGAGLDRSYCLVLGSASVLNMLLTACCWSRFPGLSISGWNKCNLLLNCGFHSRNFLKFRIGSVVKILNLKHFFRTPPLSKYAVSNVPKVLTPEL